MKYISSILLGCALLLSACSLSTQKQQTEITVDNNIIIDQLKDSLEIIIKEFPGEVGVALITDNGDTLVINNEDKYPLMSVFKLHQAISLCHLFEKRGINLDTMVTISRERLNPDTWSPMLNDYQEEKFDITIRELLRYTLVQSDNNASNYLFETIEGVDGTDNFISTLIPRNSFHLSVTEAEMWDDHSLCYNNHSSPLGVASLINKLFLDSIVSPLNKEFICSTLRECKTGTDRIVAPLTDKEGVIVAHKTGSGFRNADGVLTAHNDAAFISLPGNRNYALVVLVKDFKGTEEEAAKIIARISATIYSSIANI